jgi:signal transduction histidine kinase
VRLVPLALQPLLEGLIAELRVLADDRDIELALETHAVPAVLGDERWLKQVFVNLLDNALRYTPRGGTVTVRLWTENRRVYVAVQDTGIGIARENLPHLFERFYRTDSARARDSGGTGLGLPIVQRIAEAHGGDVQVQSDVGMGSTFTLVLPVLVPEKVRR